ncbi:phospholipase [Nocardioides mangrovicus]|uniref:phospholipase C n=1 Tax=Nocardioides mangrovicus TaxID=2478913 RepID=A0A3L8NY95_9ACTN|nr:alkaline phosphatase family protein [Nocardioides mangrovicus]RLV48125.1 phospholipase [Nocardioides mangrovicus]
MPDISRRHLLTSGAAIAGGVVGGSLLPPHLAAAVAAEPRRGSIRDIKHVVVLMQENRSFDHYFGTLAGVRGFSDPDAITLPTGRSVFYQPTTSNPDGYLLPWHLDTKTTSAQAIPSTSHAWAVQHQSINNGANDSWMPAHLAADGAAHGPYTMSYYERDDIPFHFALAQNFTVCDGYHCSLLGPTWPNRMYLMTGMIDPRGTGGGPIISNVVPTPAYSWTTYPERLEAAGVSWQVYQEEDDYGTNVLEFFQSFQDARPGSGLYERGLTISQPGRFEADCARGTLPTVSWIVPTSGKSEHPAYLPASGANFIASKLEAVAANRELWNSTLFILNYDENDGLFDHVVPPLPPAGTPDEFVGGLPIGGGVRVPCILISPWTVGGWVATENFDHTSVLQLLEQVTGVQETNISQWRRQTFGDFTSALGMGGGRRRTPPPVPDTIHRFWEAEYEVETLPAPTVPGADQTPPVQEPRRHPVPRVGTEATPRRQGHHALPGSVSRLTENRTTHRADFPDGTAGTQFPGELEQRVDKALAATGTYAWVTMVCAGGVAAIDTETYQWTSAKVSETNPYGIAATPDGSKLYVSQSGTNLVSAFDVAALRTATAKVAGTSIVVGVYPHGVVASPDGARVYVANTGPDNGGAAASETVSVIEVASDTVVGEIVVGSAPQVVAVSPSSRLLWATCSEGLYVADTTTRRSRLVTRACSQAHGVAASPDGRAVYVADTTRDRVLVVDGAGRSVIGHVRVGRGPWAVAFTTDGARAYVTNANDDTVSVIDTRSRRVVDTVSVGRIPTGISCHGSQMWVTGNVSSTVSVIETTSNTVIESIPLGISAEPVTAAFA